jgi:SAM-dependent methyltransferase
VDITNLWKAQDNYTKFLISHIPDGIKTILDVGCGTGEVAHKLLDTGYQVDCVSPSVFFAEQARELLQDKSNVFECRYEQLRAEKRYDLILFAESFQYIALEQALEKTFRLLNDDGYTLIADVFRKDVAGKGVQKGGHKLNEFYDLAKKHHFDLTEDIDITAETAPTIDILSDAIKTVGKPVTDLGLRFLSDRHPIVFKFLTWKYRRKLNKINRKYFEGGRTGDDFKKFKSYRLLLCKKAL